MINCPKILVLEIIDTIEIEMQELANHAKKERGK
jgi:hypothetical protein